MRASTRRRPRSPGVFSGIRPRPGAECGDRGRGEHLANPGDVACRSRRSTATTPRGRPRAGLSSSRTSSGAPPSSMPHRSAAARSACTWHTSPRVSSSRAGQHPQVAAVIGPAFGARRRAPRLHRRHQWPHSARRVGCARRRSSSVQGSASGQFYVPPRRSCCRKALALWVVAAHAGRSPSTTRSAAAGAGFGSTVGAGGGRTSRRRPAACGRDRGRLDASELVNVDRPEPLARCGRDERSGAPPADGRRLPRAPGAVANAPSAPQARRGVAFNRRHGLGTPDMQPFDAQ